MFASTTLLSTHSHSGAALRPTAAYKYAQVSCESSVASSCFTNSFKHITAFLAKSRTRISKKSLWRKCCVMFEIMCNPGNRTSGNSCSRDVGVGCDWWNLYSGCILGRTSVFYLFMLHPKKSGKESFHNSFDNSFCTFVTNDDHTNIDTFRLKPKPHPLFDLW